MRLKQRVDFDLSCSLSDDPPSSSPPEETEEEEEEEEDSKSNNQQGTKKELEEQKSIVQGMWFDFRVIGATSISATVCVWGGDGLFFHGSSGFSRILSLCIYIYMLFEWEKKRETDLDNTVNFRVAYWRQKEKMPGLGSIVFSAPFR